MPRSIRPSFSIGLAFTFIALAACTTAPVHGALVAGQQVTLEGSVVSVDTTPWTYDGNAVVTLSSTHAGKVRVQLPARWNLCKAQPPGDLQAFKPGDRLQVIGTATAPDELVVCAEPGHHLIKVK